MNPYLRISLIFGTVAGLAGVVYFLVLQYWIGENALVRMGSVEILITMLCALYAVGYYRDRKQDGVLHFWQGALIGLETAFIGTLILCVIIYFFVRLIDPVIFTEFLSIVEADLKKALQSEPISNNPGAQAIVRDRLSVLPQAALSSTIFFSITSIFVKNIVAEFFLTGIIAAIMRKNTAYLAKSPEAKNKK